MTEWFSIEVLDGPFSARSWQASHGDALTFGAQLEGGTDWEWHQHPWGLVWEVTFPDEAAWERFRQLTSTRAALDAVPDPILGLIVHRGRGGSSGSRLPRRPRPFAGAGAVALPVPEDLEPEPMGPHRPAALIG